MGRANMLAFVEDSEEQWFKMPALRDGDVELVRRGDAVPRRSVRERSVSG